MTLQLTPTELTFYRSIKKQAIVLLLLIRLDRPATAKHIAEILSDDYETTRKRLRELARLGAVTNSPTGWILTQGGSQLILPLSTAPVESAEFPRRLNADSAFSSSASAHQPSYPPIEEEEEEVRDQTRKFRADQEPIVTDCLQALADYGIADSPYIRRLIKTGDHITSTYIHAQAKRLRAEDKFSTGMLITVLRCGDPLPKQDTEPDEYDPDACRRYYEGKYSHLVKHDLVKRGKAN